MSCWGPKNQIRPLKTIAYTSRFWTGKPNPCNDHICHSHALESLNLILFHLRGGGGKGIIFTCISKERINDPPPIWWFPNLQAMAPTYAQALCKQPVSVSHGGVSLSKNISSGHLAHVFCQRYWVHPPHYSRNWYLRNWDSRRAHCLKDWPESRSIMLIMRCLKKNYRCSQPYVW